MSTHVSARPKSSGARQWQREAESEGILAEIEAEQQLLDAELREVERLQEVLEQFDVARKAARLAYERAKIERESAIGAIERLKYTALLRYFPNMDDTTRLVMSRIMTDSRCLVCNAPAEEKRIELEKQVAGGFCPVCGAEPITQANIVAPHEFDQTKLEQERRRAERAKLEENTKFRELRDSTTEYEKTLAQLAQTRQSIEERKGEGRAPPGQTSTYDYQQRTQECSHSSREGVSRMAGTTRHFSSGSSGLFSQIERKLLNRDRDSWRKPLSG